MKYTTYLRRLHFVNLQIVGRRPATAGNQMVFGGVHCDPVEPGIECAVTPEQRQGPVRLDKGFLSDVFYFLWILHKSRDQSSDTMLIAHHQQVEGIFVARHHLINQLLIGGFFHSRHA